MLGMAYIRVYEVATFYTMFQLSPVGKKAHVQVCGTTPCMLRGAEALVEVCKRRIHHDPHHLSADGNFSWEEVECLGVCANAPMVQIFKDTYEDLTPELFEKVLDGFAQGQAAQARLADRPAGVLPRGRADDAQRICQDGQARIEASWLCTTRTASSRTSTASRIGGWPAPRRAAPGTAPRR